MKRFFILVSMVALVAAGCTKTIIKNEVETPISFSTESGKLTRAIVDGTTLDTDQPFGVYAFANQAITDADQQTTYTKTEFMPNVEITKQDIDDNIEGKDTWRSATGSYYWPNDTRTTINFYAYSPYIGSNAASVANHQTMTVTDLDQVDDDPSTDDDESELSFTAYEHSNMYVDFMVATPVMGATFGDPNGDAQEEVAEGKVPMVFHHQMTQIIFTVKTNAAYSDINFAVQSITLKDITKSASYAQDYEDYYGEWTPSATGDFVIFPTFKAQGAPNDDAYNYIYKTNPNDEGVGGKKITNETILTTQAVTMIPQTIAQRAQKFEIVYTIDGKGVASEVVKKELYIYADGTPDWIANRKITYNVVIGLNEITFEPSVAEWDAIDEKDINDPDDEDKPYGDDFEFAQ